MNLVICDTIVTLSLNLGIREKEPWVDEKNYIGLVVNFTILFLFSVNVFYVFQDTYLSIKLDLIRRNNIRLEKNRLKGKLESAKLFERVDIKNRIQELENVNDKKSEEDKEELENELIELKLDDQ